MKIKVRDPFDKSNRYITYREADYLLSNNVLHVKTEFSNCLLCLVINTTTGELYDKYSGELLGEIIV